MVERTLSNHSKMLKQRLLSSIKNRKLNGLQGWRNLDYWNQTPTKRKLIYLVPRWWFHLQISLLLKVKIFNLMIFLKIWGYMMMLLIYWRTNLKRRKKRKLIAVEILKMLKLQIVSCVTTRKVARLGNRMERHSKRTKFKKKWVESLLLLLS